MKEFEITDTWLSDDTYVEYLGGGAPVQGFGRVKGIAFYFRARHDDWEFHASLNSSIDVGDLNMLTDDYFYIEEFYINASFMPLDEALK